MFYLAEGAVLTSTTVDGVFDNEGVVSTDPPGDYWGPATVSVNLIYNNGSIVGSSNLAFQPADPSTDPPVSVTLGPGSTIDTSQDITFNDAQISVAANTSATVANASFNNVAFTGGGVLLLTGDVSFTGTVNSADPLTIPGYLSLGAASIWRRRRPSAAPALAMATCSPATLPSPSIISGGPAARLPAPGNSTCKAMLFSRANSLSPIRCRSRPPPRRLTIRLGLSLTAGSSLELNNGATLTEFGDSSVSTPAASSPRQPATARSTMKESSRPRPPATGGRTDRPRPSSAQPSSTTARSRFLPAP